MNNMTVVYADAEEKYVKNVILYGKTADNYLYTDSKCSEANKVDKDTPVSYTHLTLPTKLEV